MLQVKNLELNDLLKMMGEAGKRLSEIGASEGAAGNISICVRKPIEIESVFPVIEVIELPQAVPELAGATFLVSGSGTRLRELGDEPEANIGCIVVSESGRSGKLYTSPKRRYERVTSEFNSHLAVHYDQMLTRNIDFHSIVHAQPPQLTYLSHIRRYQNEHYLNTHLLRWQPETIINLPEGIGFLPFQIPGSPELMKGTLESLRSHRIVIWAKHGVMARSDVSVKRAADCVEYAETAARYEYFNLRMGEIGEGLTVEEILAICKTFNIHQKIFEAE